MKAPKIIAEIGCNHKGDMAIAREMIKSLKRFEALGEEEALDSNKQFLLFA